MSEIQDLETLAERTSPKVVNGKRARHARGFITPPLWQLPASFERASAARPRKIIAEPELRKQKKPVPAPAAREPFTPVEIFSYQDLIKALISRVEQLGITRETVSALAGLPDGYAQKVLSLRPGRRIGLASLEKFLFSLSVKLVLVEDPVALKVNCLEYTPRDDPHFRSARAGHDKAALVRWAAERGLTVVFGDDTK